MKLVVGKGDLFPNFMFGLCGSVALSYHVFRQSIKTLDHYEIWCNVKRMSTFLFLFFIPIFTVPFVYTFVKLDNTHQYWIQNWLEYERMVPRLICVIFSYQKILLWHLKICFVTITMYYFNTIIFKSWGSTCFYAEQSGISSLISRELVETHM